MRYGIGIDTGGTYTDAVLYCFDTRSVEAKAKALTDHGDLSGSIDRAMRGLPAERFGEVVSVAISTTLATNACVEGKGARARLVLAGVSEKQLRMAEADRRYGLRGEDVLCVAGSASFDGRNAEPIDWDAVARDHAELFGEAEAICVAAMNAVRDGAVQERDALRALGGRWPVPFIAASELASGLNVLERGATALLNARLLPLTAEFMRAVREQLERRGIEVEYRTVRSDGCLMGRAMAAARPVETILSGPAASVVGAAALARCENCLVVDIGGTTTDIAVIRDGAPVMTEQTRIGGWRTQIRGVAVDTFALGGDTRLCVRQGELALDARRVKPLCALAAERPEVVECLRELVDSRRRHTLPIHEFLQLVRPDVDESRFTEIEREVIAALREGPAMLGGGRIDLYRADTERLEREGVVLRCGLTPTDVLHITGEMTSFDARASRLAAEYFLRCLPQFADVEALCAAAMDLARRTLFGHVAGVLLKSALPGVFQGAMPEGQFARWIEALWSGETGAADFCRLSLEPAAKLIGLGAPAHIFLPEVARRLGMECVIPENAEVANAVGAVVAGVEAMAEVEVSPLASGGYAIHGPGLSDRFPDCEEALEAARASARRIAEERARAMGARGEIDVRLEEERHTAAARYGGEVELGAQIRAAARERAGTALP